MAFSTIMLLEKKCKMTILEKCGGMGVKSGGI
jgi:hypothetical protein